MKHKKEELIYMNNLHNSLKRKISKKKIAIVSIIGFIILLVIVLICIYSLNKEFRKNIDSIIPFKHIEENNMPYISFENLNNTKIFAWSNYIAVINGNKLTKYDSIGKDVANINIEISNPIIAVNGDFAVIAEENGSKIYLLRKNEVSWEKDLEGQISRVSVNSNGYVSVIIEGTIYKSVIELYDNDGNEMFKTYLSSTIAVNTTISSDNKYLAFAEVSISGTMIQSNIKIISIEKAGEKKSNSDPIIYAYNADSNSLIIDMQYQNKNKLICRYDDSIHIIENETDNKIIDLDSNNKYNSFADINLNNFIVVTKEENTELFKDSTEVSFTNINNNKVNIYNLDGSIKSLHSSYDRVGINTGKELYFVATNGWLIKNYKSNDDIKDIVMNNSIAGVIYKNKIEIINL